MTPDGNGRHCDSCGKTVIDFSKFTDRELIEFWKKAKGKLCGRFSEYQVNRAIPIPVESNSIFHKALFGTAIAAGLATVANGQTTHNMPSIQVPVPSAQIQTNSTTTSNKQKESKTQQTAPTQVQGMVIDAKTNKPLQGVAVSIIDGIVARTDADGKFTLPIPDSLQGKTLSLRFDKYEHKSRTISLNPKKQATYMKVEMEFKKEVFFMGDVAPGYYNQ